MFATTPNSILDYHAFVVRGDTLINTIAYKKLFYQGFANQWPFEPPYLIERGASLGRGAG